MKSMMKTILTGIGRAFSATLQTAANPLCLLAFVIFTTLAVYLDLHGSVTGLFMCIPVVLVSFMMFVKTLNA